ncbi:MAG: Fic family protein [Terrimesophilobacter sp.]
MTYYLEPDQALRVIKRIGLLVRDEGLLFSALARPIASAFGQDAYPSLELKAGALMSSVARNHALFDGNKRVSWVLTVAFLNLNDTDLAMTQDEKFNLVLAVAQGELGLEEIARVLGAHLVAESSG